jgi:DNA-binding NarL/FixJ family response regulator
MSEILVGIYDEHRLIQEAFCHMLKDIPDVEVVLSVNSGSLLLPELKTKLVHVLIMNIHSLNATYLSLIQEIGAAFPKIKILVYSINESEDFIVKTIKAGSKGFLAKDSGMNDLMEAIYSLRNGFDYYSKSIASLLVKKYVGNLQSNEHGITEEGMKTLSSREIEILKLWGNSMTNPEISEKLFISVRTVESHKNHIMQKLNLKTTVDMLKFAIKNNIIDL